MMFLPKKKKNLVITKNLNAFALKSVNTEKLAVIARNSAKKIYQDNFLVQQRMAKMRKDLFLLNSQVRNDPDRRIQDLSIAEIIRSIYSIRSLILSSK